MSSICNKDPNPKPIPNRSLVNLTSESTSLSEITEYEVEQGSAALANSLRHILSAISTIELHVTPMVPSYFEAALESCRTAIYHYKMVSKIDPNHGSDTKEQIAIRSLDLSNALERWNKHWLIPDLFHVAQELEVAASGGQPAKLLEVFTSRLQNATEYLEKLVTSPIIMDNRTLQWNTWVVTSLLVETMMAGQMVAIINREAREKMESI